MLLIKAALQNSCTHQHKANKKTPFPCWWIIQTKYIHIFTAVTSKDKKIKIFIQERKANWIQDTENKTQPSRATFGLPYKAAQHSGQKAWDLHYPRHPIPPTQIFHPLDWNYRHWKAHEQKSRSTVLAQNTTQHDYHNHHQDLGFSFIIFPLNQQLSVVNLCVESRHFWNSKFSHQMKLVKAQIWLSGEFPAEGPL